MAYVFPLVAPLFAPCYTALLAAHAPTSALARQSLQPVLHTQLAAHRAALTRQLASAQRDGTLSIAIAMEVLQLTPTGGRALLRRWRELGLLRPSTPRTALTVDSVIGLALTRTLWPLERVHLPDIPPTEPAWWCWRQDAPAAPILPCPVPLPAEVPPTARLWSPWAGAPWIDARIAHDETAP